MRFRCERDALTEVLQTAARAVGTRASLPVLSGLRLELSGSRLRVTGTDLDLWISADLEVAGTGDGVVVVLGRLLTETVRSLPEGAVDVELRADEVVLRAERVEFSLRTILASEYPVLPEVPADAATVEAAELEEAIRQVANAASQEESRPILRGVKMEAEGDGVRLVATDSYRLAVRDLPGTSLLREGQSVLVPRTSLLELVRLLGEVPTVTLHLGERDVAFEVGAVTVHTRLIEGQFPDYRALIPEAHPNRLTVGRQALAEAVKRVRVVARDATATPVRLAMKPGVLELSATTQDYGAAYEQLDCSFEGSELTVAFNPDYLLDGVEAARCDEVTLETVDELKPALLRSREAPEYRYVLMPVRYQ